jgi:hypothetical protein
MRTIRRNEDELGLRRVKRGEMSSTEDVSVPIAVFETFTVSPTHLRAHMVR